MFRRLSVCVFACLLLAVGTGLVQTEVTFAAPEWRRMYSGTTQGITCVWGSSVNDVFAGCATYSDPPQQDQELILHYDGSAWSSMGSASELGFCVTGIWGSSSSDVFFYDWYGPCHYDGTTWTRGNPPDPYSHYWRYVGIYPIAIWASSPSDVFILTQGGWWEGVYPNQKYHHQTLVYRADLTQYYPVIARWVVSEWVFPQDIWGSSASDIFVVAANGNIAHFDGASWTSMSSGSTEHLCSVWGSSSSDVFAVGYNGTILHYDGTAWTSMSSGTTEVLWGIWGTSGSDVFAGGGDGSDWSPVILHYDGTAWRPMTTAMAGPLVDFWGTCGPDGNVDVFGVGAWGTILHYRNVSAPVVSTSPATDVTKQSATLNGSVTDDGGEACQYRFRYKEAKGSYVYTSWSGSVTSGQSFSEPIGGLKSNATYYFNAQAKNSVGESAWGNEQSFVADSVDFEISRVRMVSPNELGMDIKVRFPKGFPNESPRKVDFWANVNGTDVEETCDITSFVGPGESANIRFDDPWGSVGPHRIINFESQEVPRFQDNMSFTLYGVAYWEGGQRSYVYSIPVEIPLPVIIIHGYAYTHTAKGWTFEKIKIAAYENLMGFLAENGYTTDPYWYRTMWGPTDCQYQADKLSEQDIYRDVDFWVRTALKKEDGTPRTYADKVNLIGHCFGGLVARYYSGFASNINKVIMIATPHLGITSLYEQAFDKSSKEQADEILRVNPRDPHSEENLLRWGEPEYGESCLVDATTGDAVPEPYENTFNRAYNSNVDYLSIYANPKDTPYKLVVNKKRNGWYEVVGYCPPEPGDGSVLALSGSDFYPDAPITEVQRSLLVQLSLHVFICEDAKVQERVLDFLSDR